MENHAKKEHHKEHTIDEIKEHLGKLKTDAGKTHYIKDLLEEGLSKPTVEYLNQERRRLEPKLQERYNGLIEEGKIDYLFDLEVSAGIGLNYKNAEKLARHYEVKGMIKEAENLRKSLKKYSR